jgi:hypothetical protein
MEVVPPVVIHSEASRSVIRLVVSPVVTEGSLVAIPSVAVSPVEAFMEAASTVAAVDK